MKMAPPTVYEKVIAVISKAHEQRTDFECHELVSWIRKQNKLFANLKHDILKDLIKNCEFYRTKTDDVIIKQGDKGDAMYAMLKGSVSIYIISDIEEDICQYTEKVCSKSKLDRASLGQHIFSHREGFVFGDVALIRDCTRTASVVADEPCDLLVVDRALYNRTVREVLNLEWQEKTQFVQNNPLFSDWSSRHRKQLVISLRKESYQFGSVVAKQGQPIQNIYFVLRGEIEVSMDFSLHCIQHPELWAEIEGSFPELIGIQTRSRTSKSGNQRQVCRVGPKSKSYTVCLLSINEHIGSLEMTMDIGKHLDTTVVAGAVDLLVLDRKHYERLLVKRHPQSVERLKKELTTRQLLALSRLGYPPNATLMKYLTMKLLNGGDMLSLLTQTKGKNRQRTTQEKRQDTEIVSKVRKRLQLSDQQDDFEIPSKDSKKTFLERLEEEIGRLVRYEQSDWNRKLSTISNASYI